MGCGLYTSSILISSLSVSGSTYENMIEVLQYNKRIAFRQCTQCESESAWNSRNVKKNDSSTRDDEHRTRGRDAATVCLTEPDGDRIHTEAGRLPSRLSRVASGYWIPYPIKRPDIVNQPSTTCACAEVPGHGETSTGYGSFRSSSERYACPRPSYRPCGRPSWRR